MRPSPDAATGFNPGRMNAAPTGDIYAIYDALVACKTRCEIDMPGPHKCGPTRMLDSVPVGGAFMRPSPDAATGFNPGRINAAPAENPRRSAMYGALVAYKIRYARAACRQPERPRKKAEG